jgi:hypothetical protein
MFSCWVAFVLSIFLAIITPFAAIVIGIGFIGFMGCIFYLTFGLRCPKCRNSLGQAINWPPSFWRISDKLNYCPFCGTGLDEDENGFEHRVGG